jgi:hypothetical protein
LFPGILFVCLVALPARAEVRRALVVGISRYNKLAKPRLMSGGHAAFG